jgi:flagellin FlaB
MEKRTQSPMIMNTVKFLKRLRNEEVGSPTVKSAVRFVKRIGTEEDGITALETAIILIAFVVVASVFAFTMLSAGTFSTERGKETIYAGLNEVQSSMEIKGGVIAEATPSTASVSGTVTALVFTLSNVLGGEAINLSDGDDAVVVFEYRDATQRIPITSTATSGWSVDWLGNVDEDGLLEAGELAEITVPLSLTNPLQTNTTFVLEIKPPSGAVLNLQRTTPAWLEAVNDLQ